jgi:microcin C transport system permease protein
MGSYLIRRLLLVIPTLWAIITINFFIVQIAPGGPVDQAIAAIEFGQRGGMPGAGDGGMGASHARTGAGNISEGTIAAGAASIRKSSPRSPTATASINRCTSAT